VTGDTVREIRTDSIDEAIKILEEQKTILGKTISDKNVIGVVDGIESAIKNLKEAKSLEAKTKKLVAEKQEAVNKTIELTAKSDLGRSYRVRPVGPASPEAGAKVVEAAVRVDAIVRELNSKQLELQKAAREFEALSPNVQWAYVVAHQKDFGTEKSRPADVHDPIATEMAAEIKELEDRLDKCKTKAGSQYDPAMKLMATRLAKLQREYAMLPANVKEQELTTKALTITPPDQQRIAELEAKLQKLVDEVNSLKKDQKPGTQTLERSVGPDGRPINAPKR
jgi:hypothetical protein